MDSATGQSDIQSSQISKMCFPANWNGWDDIGLPTENGSLHMLTMCSYGNMGGAEVALPWGREEAAASGGRCARDSTLPAHPSTPATGEMPPFTGSVPAGYFAARLQCPWDGEGEKAMVQLVSYIWTWKNSLKLVDRTWCSGNIYIQHFELFRMFHLRCLGNVFNSTVREVRIFSFTQCRWDREREVCLRPAG